MLPTLRKNAAFFGATLVVLVGATTSTNPLYGDIASDVARSGGSLFASFDAPSATAIASLVPIRADLEPGTHRFEIDHDGSHRSYRVHVPARAPRGRLPVVFNFHGHGSSGWEQELTTGMSRLADERGFVVVYPESLDGSWDAGTCCSETPRDDVGFVRKVVEDVSRRLPVDAQRIYATGLSNGGFLTYRLVCEASDIFAAVAPVAAHLGTPEGEDAPDYQKFACDPAQRVPILHLHGTADDHIEYDLTPGVIGPTDSGAPDTVAFFARRNGCDPEPEVTHPQPGLERTRYRGCEDGADVTLWAADGGGHCWPGNPVCWGYGEPMPALKASQWTWEFFSRHVKPDPAQGRAAAGPAAGSDPRPM